VHCHEEVCVDRFTKLLVENKTNFVGRRWRICEGGRPMSRGGYRNSSVETLVFATFNTDVENFRLAH
jgi:hypothetical protein